MSDFAASTSDRAARRERETPHVRKRAAQILAALDLRGKSSIERSLAIGAACPFTSQWEKEVWLEEVRAMEGVNA